MQVPKTRGVRVRPEGRTGRPTETGEEEAQAAALLPPLWARIDELLTLDDRGYFELEPGSALDLDDCVSYPHKISGNPRLGIIGAIDHVRAVRMIIDTGAVPMNSLFTLLRSALETAFSAIYLLEPDARDERIRRGLRDLHQEMVDGRNMRADFGALNPRKGDERRVDALRRALAGYPAAGPWAQIKARTEGSTARGGIASKIIVSRRPRQGRAEYSIRGYWRAFSGLTHGRSWAAHAVLDFEEVGYDAVTGTVTGRMTTSLRSIVGSMAVALDAIEVAVEIYGRRKAEFMRSPEDTALHARLLAEERAEDELED
ncbi:hypothetical protein GCM10022288_15790 [Gryllotalpicola kribbensis]|uniref:Uncharacterized protein n=2 Tax=Gryllotalpicola kribbensis TaxID=993084 RepID=A0ABP8AS45_9MICO